MYKIWLIIQVHIVKALAPQMINGCTVQIHLNPLLHNLCFDNPNENDF